MQGDVLSGALSLVNWCPSILQKLWNRIQEYPDECIVVFKMLPNQLLGGANFRGIGSIGRVSESILVHLEPGAILSGSDYYTVYIK